MPDTSESIKTRLMEIAGTKEARIKDYGKMQFIDCGEAFEFVACPSCKTKLTLELWQTLMAKDWHNEDGFHLRGHSLPCCAAEHTLNDLDYCAEQGFAHWFVSAKTTNSKALSSNELAILEELSGLSLRAIFQQY